jgi:hypothetical protein
MENTMQEILTTYFKPLKTYKLGANHLKNRFQECGMEFLPDDEFMEYMAVLGHKKDKYDRYKFSMRKIKN